MFAVLAIAVQATALPSVACCAVACQSSSSYMSRLLCSNKKLVTVADLRQVTLSDYFLPTYSTHPYKNCSVSFLLLVSLFKPTCIAKLFTMFCAVNCCKRPIVVMCKLFQTVCNNEIRCIQYNMLLFLLSYLLFVMDSDEILKIGEGR